jgi:hypothetical protein
MQADRQERSYDVQANYLIEYVGLQAWVVQHPDEPERCYLVDMIREHCTCPDFCCTAQQVAIWCKHMLAVQPDWERLTGKKRSAFTRNTEADIAAREMMQVSNPGEHVTYRFAADGKRLALLPEDIEEVDPFGD